MVAGAGSGRAGTTTLLSPIEAAIGGCAAAPALPVDRAGSTDESLGQAPSA